MRELLGKATGVYSKERETIPKLSEYLASEGKGTATDKNKISALIYFQPLSVIVSRTRIHLGARGLAPI